MCNRKYDMMHRTKQNVWLYRQRTLLKIEF